MEELSVFDFGNQLLETNDLDPVYVMLWDSSLTQTQLKRWLLAYWCFYHCGTCSWIVDQSDYWRAMLTAAKSKEYPRGTERRHFRGQAAVSSVESFKALRVSPEDLVDSLVCNGRISLGLTMRRVTKWRGFGSWISFKVADMLERLGLSRVIARPQDVFLMFEAPRKGALEMASRCGGPSDESSVFGWAYRKLIEQLGDYLAPPRYERSVNIFEMETVLCKWKSHLGGHYPVGKDTGEIHEHLHKFPCKTSQRLLTNGRDKQLW